MAELTESQLNSTLNSISECDPRPRRRAPRLAARRGLGHCGRAGGYGDVAERDPALIADDLSEGWITPEGARRDYGYG